MESEGNIVGSYGKGIGAKREGRHSDILREQGRELSKRIMWVSEMLVEIDRLLESWGSILEISQPPKTGKLGLRWWKLSAKDRLREPVTVVWKRGKDARFYATAVPINTFGKKVKRGGGFSVNTDVTREVVHYIVGLLKMREMLKKELGYRAGLHVDVLKRDADIIGFQHKRSGEIWRTLKGE